MAVEGIGAAMQLPQGMSPTEVTLPESNLCHYIADGELERLGEMRKDRVMEICLASAGIFAGSLIPAIDGFRRFGAETNPATVTDLASMLIAFASLAVAGITGYQWRVRSGLHQDMVTQIRSRQKVPVSSVQ